MKTHALKCSMVEKCSVLFCSVLPGEAQQAIDEGITLVTSIRIDCSIQIKSLFLAMTSSMPITVIRGS